MELGSRRRKSFTTMTGIIDVFSTFWFSSQYLLCARPPSSLAGDVHNGSITLMS